MGRRVLLQLEASLLGIVETRVRHNGVAVKAQLPPLCPGQATQRDPAAPMIEVEIVIPRQTRSLDRADVRWRKKHTAVKQNNVVTEGEGAVLLDAAEAHLTIATKGEDVVAHGVLSEPAIE